jgi:hypothetical protein
VESTTKTYGWNGFLPPLAQNYVGTVINKGNAGRAYPVKFQLLDGSGNYISSLSAVKSEQFGASTACSSPTSTSDPIDYSVTASTSGLQYDSTSNQYVYTWKTPASAGCYMLKIGLADGESKFALFSLQ